MNKNRVLKTNRKGTEYIEVNGEIVEKRCTSCGEMKDLSNFTNHKYGTGGTVSRCKPCIVEYGKEYDKKYYEKNREKIRQRKKEADKRYYEKNKERIIKRVREAYKKKKGSQS